ncbi:amidohydrolase family protein [Solitalea koreensis]|uniref:L-fuconolactonase n=1 Tax=Solitalea koreensis TaxID=543615 RepID=A0A521BIU8_9SPHI|nr:amidohydrolase family protein [Solitalea koreensis]SMO46969.1 L-fuconolactonase [Solitalea koreensis]
MRIDSHQHFWKYNQVRDAWITDDMKVIQRDFLPEDLAPVFKENYIDGCVAVQADQSEEETYFLLDLAIKNEFIKGVVGWVDLRADNLEERLIYFSSYKKLKGFRHILQAEVQDDFLLKPDFCKGISKLKEFGFTYDLLVAPKHLPYVIEFVKRFPDQPFVLDHLAKPYIKDGKIEEWKKDIQILAQYPNLYCKLSGMVTEADWNNWNAPIFKPYIDTVIECFGVERVMFGSDWPVSLLAASYKECCEILELNTAALSQNEKDKLWGINANNFYSLEHEKVLTVTGTNV